MFREYHPVIRLELQPRLVLLNSASFKFLLNKKGPETQLGEGYWRVPFPMLSQEQRPLYWRHGQTVLHFNWALSLMSTKTTQEIMKHCMHIPIPFIHLPFVFETEMRRNTFFSPPMFEVVPGNVNKSFKHFDILKYTVTLGFFSSD